MAKDRIGLVEHAAVAGVSKTHALQGGGYGLGYRFIEATWCGIDKRSPTWRYLRPTDGEPTCLSCVKARRATILKDLRDARTLIVLAKGSPRS